VVFKAILEAGCRPCFVDVEYGSYGVSAEDLHARKAEFDAVIAVHMFGNVCDIGGLRREAEGRPMIEDCAQSLGSTLDGRMTGSFGEAAVFSFRSGKYLSVGEGGALFTSNDGVRSRATALIDHMAAPRKSDELTHVAATYLRSKLRSRPLYGVIGSWLWHEYVTRVDISMKSPMALSQIYSSDFAIANDRMASLDSAIARRRSIADSYVRRLSLGVGMSSCESHGTYCNRYAFPVLFGSLEERDWMAGYLRARRIDTGQPYKDIAREAAALYGYAGGCPVAEEAAARVLLIPGYQTLTDREVDRICAAVNAGFAEVASRRHGAP
jgi:dTDP-4-amino-4,6-dideoxygalactose transaminase